MIENKQLLDLEKQISSAEKEINILQDNWAHEILVLSKDAKFDPFSKKGEKKLGEIAEKYVDIISEAENRHDILVDEYNRILDELAAEEQAKESSK